MAANDLSLLASLPPLTSSYLVSTSRSLFGDDGQFSGRVVGYYLEGEPDDLVEARLLFEAVMVPAAPKDILKMLHRLKLLTVARNTDHADLTLQLAAYASELGDWPADVVRQVLADQPSRSKWWPAWAELEEALAQAMQPRAALRDALWPRQGAKLQRRVAPGMWVDRETAPGILDAG